MVCRQLLLGLAIASLTRQLLAFSRKQLLELMVLNLNEVINNLNSMSLRQITADIELTCTLNPGFSA